MSKELNNFKLKPIHYISGAVVGLIALAIVFSVFFMGGGDAQVSDSAQLNQSKNIDSKVSTKSVGGDDSSKTTGDIKADGNVSF